MLTVGIIFCTHFILLAQTPASPASPVAAVDPNKESSEFNHHMAGWGLVGVGILVLVAILFPQVRSIQYVWPALFLIVAIFLATWSDAEIWPRGNLSWAWLIHHDQEARQHKIYAVLMLAMGIVEYLRVRGKLPRFWRIWAFPILAVIGASLLLVHDHTQGSGAASPEARAYLVNPNLDANGKPFPVVSENNPPPMMDHSNMNMDHSGMDHSGMDHSGMNMDAGVEHSAMHMEEHGSDGHHHHMTASMLMVEREHFWFMIVGIGIALFKFLGDANFFRTKFFAYAWPSCMVLLGALLVMYRE
jgi:hypothetical protein